ncbi:MAG TPA: TolC family protein [Acidobacteriota bacterium]|jgi:outer membrane protein TolC|nr:TolC family protein [Acidobacteriota bacterium]
MVALFTVNASGQTQTELSLDQAIQRALQNHPIIQIRKAHIDTLAAEITQARSARFPQITAAAQGKLGLSGTTGGLGLQGLVASPFYKNVAAREQLALAKSERYPRLAGIWSGGLRALLNIR